MSRRSLGLFAVLLGVLCVGGFSSALHAGESQKPKNVIVIIGDGMGLEQIRASRIYRGGEKNEFEKFPVFTKVTTFNAHDETTDSAAAATALATGEKVTNGVVSQRIPGDKHDLPTVLEKMKQLGKSTGLVTTTVVTDATPAAFGAHTSSRVNTKDILEDYFQSSMPHVVFGAEDEYYREYVRASSAGYKMISNVDQLKDISLQVARGELACVAGKCPYIYGGFGRHDMIPGRLSTFRGLPLEIAGNEYFQQKRIPHLSEMAKTALDVLSQNPSGFFVMIETGEVDWIGHANQGFDQDLQGTPTAVNALALEMAELNRLVDVVNQFMGAHPDTLVLVTADHETGGLKLNEEETTCLGQKTCLPKAAWTSPTYMSYGAKIAEHTNVPVGLYAKGVGAERFASCTDNTQIPERILSIVQ